MGHPLWAPWRIDYILGPKQKGGCIFCGIASLGAEARRERLVVCATERAFVVLNRYPFAAGHLLVVPHVHEPDLESLGEAENTELFRLVREACIRLRGAVKPEGLNVGVNIGAPAGAGIAEHVHVHVVPRWSGDTNFMPVLADTRVVPQALDATRDHLEPFFADHDRVPSGEGKPGGEARA